MVVAWKSSSGSRKFCEDAAKLLMQMVQVVQLDMTSKIVHRVM